MKPANKEFDTCIDRITGLVANIIEVVGDDRATVKEKLDGIDGLKYIPTPFEIAKYYGIRIVYKRMAGLEPSYLNRKMLTVFISDKYRKDEYTSRKLIAHELGHFFLDNSPLSAMNGDILNEYLPMETRQEYEANVFAVLLMPQIMCGEPWEDYSPRILNRKVYKKLFKENT